MDFEDLSGVCNFDAIAPLVFGPIQQVVRLFEHLIRPQYAVLWAVRNPKRNRDVAHGFNRMVFHRSAQPLGHL